MKSSIVVSAIGVIITAFFLFSSCRKINESTSLGDDLIPPIDNVNTFDTTLTVEAYNELFTLLNDTLRLSRNEVHYLGVINNDPLFGKTDARIFVQMKPTFYPFIFNRVDSLTIDSVVLVLGHVDTYGDTLANQTVRVYELPTSTDFRYDSLYNIRENSFMYSSELGNATFNPRILDDSVYAFRDTTAGQLRIKLNNTFGQRLLNYDSTATGAYRSDSAFNTYFKGFAIQSFSGNAVMGFDLQSANTKLAIYYNYPIPGGLGRDTTVTYFAVTGRSANANYVIRDYNGSELASYQGGTSPDDLIYLQNTPGTFARIKIPGLDQLSNRVVHRAELIVEQVYHPSDAMFPPPNFMYLDAYDTSLKKYRTIPYDLNIDLSGNINRQQFGMIGIKSTDAFNNPITVWRFNISRYVQHIFTKTDSLMELRLLATYYVLDQYRPPGSTSFVPFGIYINPSIVKGRVRVGGGNHATQRMRLRIVYSKI